MKKIYSLLILTILYSFTNAQTIAVETNTFNYGNFKINRIILQVYKGNRSKFIGIPATFTSENSLIKQARFSKNDTVFALIGDIDNNQRICIIDINRNLDFSDDYIYRYNKNTVTRNNHFPSQLVSYKVNENNKELLVHRFIAPFFYDSNNMNVSPDNDLFHKYYLTFDLSDSYEGYFHLEGTSYGVIAFRDWENKPSSYLILDSLIVRDNISGEQSLPISESLLLGKYLIKNVRLSDDNTSILLDTVFATKKILSGYKEGFYAHNIQGKDVKGKKFNLDLYRGKYVLLDFWGTWCNPCIALLPHIAELHAKYKELKIVSLASHENEKSALRVPDFIKQYKMDWINLCYLDDSHGIQPWRLYNVSSFPTTILIDPDGKIIHRASTKEMSELDKKLEVIFNKTKS